MRSATDRIQKKELNPFFHSAVRYKTISCFEETIGCFSATVKLILQGIRTSKDSPRQTLSSTSSTAKGARMLQALHKNSKQTCETQQTAPLAADCTPTLKSATQNHQRTKNQESQRDSCALYDSLFLSMCKLVTCKNESYLPLFERGMPLYTLFARLSYSCTK